MMEEQKTPISSLVSPHNSSQFVGNRTGVCLLRKWLQETTNNPRTAKRVCFLTGPVGSGKSVLARVLLQEFGYTIREFNASDLRMKPTRDLLVQTLGYHDVLALLNRFSSISTDEERKADEFRKAVLIEDFEDMGLATQEIYRTIRDMIKKKRTKGVPVIFTGNKVFRGKKPMSGNSMFIHLKYRSIQENQMVIKYFITTLLKQYPNNSTLRKIGSKEQFTLAKECGGDVRRVLKHLEYAINSEGDTSLSSLEMANHETRGPLISLYRVLNVKQERTLDEVYTDLTIEGMTVPFGVHWSYIHYVPWLVRSSKIPGEKKCCSELWRDIAHYFADYAMITDQERITQSWGMREIATLIAGWGTRVRLQHALQTDYRGQEEIRFLGNDLWWLELEKGKRQGDAPVQTPCITKTLQGSLHLHQLQNLSFQMLAQNIGDSKAWKPGTNRRTIELLRLRKMDFPGKDRLTKLLAIDDKDE